MKCKIVTRAEELRGFGWDTLEHESVYLHSDWLAARSQTIKGQPRFLLLLDNDDRAIAGVPSFLVDRSSHPGFLPTGVLTASDLTDEELGSLGADRQIIGDYRKYLAEHADAFVPALVTGTPARFGGISLRRGLSIEERSGVATALVEAIEHQAAADRAATLSWLFLAEGESPEIEKALFNRGYQASVVDAECYLPLRWADFSEYLQSFRAHYRRTIRLEIEALEQAGITISSFGAEALGHELAVLEQQWRLKYGRTPSVDEILSDYSSLQEYMGDKITVFVARADDKAVGFSVFLVDGQKRYARFGGFDYNAGNVFLYFNLLFYAPIRKFINEDVDSIHYAMKSYDAKVARGCQLQLVRAFLPTNELTSPLSEGFLAMDEAQRNRFLHIAQKRTMHDLAPPQRKLTPASVGQYVLE